MNAKKASRFPLLPLFLTLGLTLGASAKNNDSFSYYSDGIYDTYVVLNNDIKKGLNERYMSEYENMFLVAVDVEDVSTTDIIYYKTIGMKNSLEPAVVRFVPTGRNYMVFDKFDRNANAYHLQKRLTEFGLESQVYKCDGPHEYQRNPIVIKKLIRDLKESIKDTPVRVIAVEKTVGEKLPSLDAYSQSRKKTKKKTVKKDKLQREKNGDVIVSFLRTSEAYCASGSITADKIQIGNNTYSIGDDIGMMSFVLTRQERGERVAVLLGKDNKYYKLKKSRCTKVGISSPALKKDTPKAKKETTKKEEKPNQKESYTCDFTQVTTVKSKDGNTLRVEDTPYAHEKKMAVTAKQHDDGYFHVKGKGIYEVLLSGRAFKKACSNN